MLKILKADKDTYITDRLVKGVRVTTSNVGAAGSLDLFKLFGLTTSASLPNTELSRLLVHFDLEPLRTLISIGRIDVTHQSFNCTLKLFDVYGGQATPDHFMVSAYPLSRSFNEGLGRDVVYYADVDNCNFLTSSDAQGTWFLSGCGFGGGLPGSVDYVTASVNVNAGISLKSSQFFTTGEEDLELNVTLAVSATLAGLLPDEGFRISLDQALESDQYTYFVKRFASRTAFNEDKHPRMIVKYDDSIQDDSQNLVLDSSGSLFLYNYAQNRLSNLTSGSAGTQVTGSNSLILKLSTEVSGGTYEVVFTGSQHQNGIIPVVGTYSASIFLPSSNQVLSAKLAQSGSVKLVPIWGSLDGMVPYTTGSAIYVRRPSRGGASLAPQKLVITVHNVEQVYGTTQEATLRINIFDHTSPLITIVKVPVELPGLVIRDVHWQVRDVVTQVVEIPFDTVHNSTRASSDTSGMYFRLDISNLTPGRTYVIDVMVVVGNDRQLHKASSPIFRVNDLE